MKRERGLREVVLCRGKPWGSTISTIVVFILQGVNQCTYIPNVLLDHL